MSAFAVVAGDENFAGGDDDIDFAGGVEGGAVGVGDASGVVWVETVGVFVVENCQDAFFDLDAFVGEGDDALDDVLVFDARSGLAGEIGAVAAVGEDDDLAAFRCVFVAHEMRSGDGEAVDDDAVARL